jgi:hypothetical protein
MLMEDDPKGLLGFLAPEVLLEQSGGEIGSAYDFAVTH